VSRYPIHSSDRVFGPFPTQKARTLKHARPSAWYCCIVFMLCLALAAISTSCLGQVPPPAVPDNGLSVMGPIGTPPRASVDGTSESVNFANGALSVYIPMLSLPQRGGCTLPIGRLSAEWTLPASVTGGCTTTAPMAGFIIMRKILAYDAMGGVLSEQQCTPNLSGPGKCTTTSPNSFVLSYLYDLAGNPTAFTNGVTNVPIVGAITFGLQYDAAGRLQDLSSSWNPALGSSGGPFSLFTANGYTAAGAIQHMVLGNNIFVNKTYDIRLRTTGETATHP
jgi:hypothetical protein